jgi:hypothetical protein
VYFPYQKKSKLKFTNYKKKCVELFFELYLTLSRQGGCLGGVLSLAIHISPNRGPINMILSAKPLYYVPLIYFECSIMSIGPLVAKLQQVYGLCGR